MSIQENHNNDEQSQPSTSPLRSQVDLVMERIAATLAANKAIITPEARPNAMRIGVDALIDAIRPDEGGASPEEQVIPTFEGSAASLDFVEPDDLVRTTLDTSGQNVFLSDHPLQRVIPPEVLSVVEHRYNGAGIDPEMMIATFLSVCAAAMSTGVNVEISESESIPLNVFFCIGSPVASGKSTVMKLFMKGVKRFHEEFKNGMGRWREEFFVQSNVSAAGLMEEMGYHFCSSIYLVEDESRKILGDLLHKNGEELRTLLTKGFQRESYSRRVKNEHLEFASVGLDVIFLTQKDVVERFASSRLIIDSGLFSRFLIVDSRKYHPTPMTKSDNYDPAHEERIAEVIFRLCERFRVKGQKSDGCFSLGLGADGMELLSTIWEAETERQDGRPDSFFQRTIHHTVRIAGVLAVSDAMFHAVRNESIFSVPEVLDVSYLDAAYHYVKKLGDHAARTQIRGCSDLFELVSLLAKNEGGVALVDLKEHGYSAAKLNTLLHRYPNFLSKSTGKSKAQGGRPPTIIQLNPSIMGLFRSE